VAGVGPGLGRDIARGLAAAGCDLVLAARTTALAEEVAAELRPAGVRVVVQAADLDREGDRTALAARVDTEYGRLDAYVHNAYTLGPHQDLADADLDAWRAVMETNLWSPLAVTRALLPLLRAGAGAGAGAGNVVLISAMTTRMVSARGRGAYAISKAALNQATRTMAYEFGPDGIRVNAVLPGWMDNAVIDEWRADPEKAAVVARAEAAIPLGAIPTCAEVASAVVFLARHPGAVTGQLLDANGGQCMA
jgi:NAD(P)-dependent dehydrogenase (short-subunit alcohol dehydrogenase family)